MLQVHVTNDEDARAGSVSDSSGQEASGLESVPVPVILEEARAKARAHATGNASSFMALQIPLLGDVSFKDAVKEFVAMTVYVVVGCGSAMAVAKDSGWVLQVAVSFGVGWSVLAYAFEHHSSG